MRDGTADGASECETRVESEASGLLLGARHHILKGGSRHCDGLKKVEEGVVMGLERCVVKNRRLIGKQQLVSGEGNSGKLGIIARGAHWPDSLGGTQGNSPMDPYSIQYACFRRLACCFRPLSMEHIHSLGII